MTTTTPPRFSTRSSISDPANEALAADIEVDGNRAWITFHLPGGPVPERDQYRLALAVLEHPAVQGADELYLSLPLGHRALLSAVEETCDLVEARAAGSTCLIETHRRGPGQAET